MDFTNFRCRECYLPAGKENFHYVKGIGCLHMVYNCPHCKRTVFMPLESGLDIPTVKSKKLIEFESGAAQQNLF